MTTVDSYGFADPLPPDVPRPPGEYHEVNEPGGVPGSWMPRADLERLVDHLTDDHLLGFDVVNELDPDVLRSTHRGLHDDRSILPPGHRHG